MSRVRPLMPTARTEGLVIEQFAGEILVYDLKRHKGHCLNSTAALVWRRCDGRTTVAEVAATLQEEMSLPASEAVVWTALDRLERAQLLVARVTVPESRARHSRRASSRRRALIRSVGISFLLPVVESIVAPHAVEAASTTTSHNCNHGPCTGINLPCSDKSGTTCRETQPGKCSCI
jgi:Coenzyme PQQ synthesis protein D (PqqD)